MSKNGGRMALGSFGSAAPEREWDLSVNSGRISFQSADDKNTLAQHTLLTSRKATLDEANI